MLQRNRRSPGNRYTLSMPMLSAILHPNSIAYGVARQRGMEMLYRKGRTGIHLTPLLHSVACSPRVHLSNPRYTEIRFEEAVTEPERTFRSLFEFLDEPWDPGVLEFYNGDHHNADEDSLSAARDRAKAGGRAFSIDRIGSGARELDPLTKLFFSFKAGDVMRELGYW